MFCKNVLILTFPFWDKFLPLYVSVNMQFEKAHRTIGSALVWSHIHSLALALTLSLTLAHSGLQQLSLWHSQNRLPVSLLCSAFIYWPTTVCNCQVRHVELLCECCDRLRALCATRAILWGQVDNSPPVACCPRLTKTHCNRVCKNKSVQLSLSVCLYGYVCVSVCERQCVRLALDFSGFSFSSVSSYISMQLIGFCSSQTIFSFLFAFASLRWLVLSRRWKIISFSACKAL